MWTSLWGLRDGNNGGAPKAILGFACTRCAHNIPREPLTKQQITVWRLWHTISKVYRSNWSWINFHSFKFALKRYILISAPLDRPSSPTTWLFLKSIPSNHNIQILSINSPNLSKGVRAFWWVMWWDGYLKTEDIRRAPIMSSLRMRDSRSPSLNIAHETLMLL